MDIFWNHTICNGRGPEYLSSYVNYVKSIAMITAQEPQKWSSARKIQASELSIPVPLVCGTKLNHLLETYAFTEAHFNVLENSVTEHFSIKYIY